MILKKIVNCCFFCCLVFSCLLFLPFVRVFLGNFCCRILFGRTPNHLKLLSSKVLCLAIFLFAFSCFGIFYFSASRVKAYQLFSVLPYAIIVVVSFLILYKANWIFGDDHEFISSTVIGKTKSLFYNSFAGRLFFQFDYNILLLTPFYSNILHITY